MKPSFIIIILIQLVSVMARSEPPLAEYRFARAQVREFLRYHYRNNLAEYYGSSYSPVTDQKFIELTTLLNKSRNRVIRELGFEALATHEFAEQRISIVESARTSKLKVSDLGFHLGHSGDMMAYYLTEQRNDLLFMEIAILPDPQSQKLYDAKVAQMREKYSQLVYKIKDDPAAKSAYETVSNQKFSDLLISASCQGKLK